MQNKMLRTQNPKHQIFVCVVAQWNKRFSFFFDRQQNNIQGQLGRSAKISALFVIMKNWDKQGQAAPNDIGGADFKKPKSKENSL